MKPTIVNGHVLPGALVQAIASGRWGTAAQTADLSMLPIADTDDLAFLDVAAMEQNTRELYTACDRGDAALFALTQGDAQVSGWLNVTHAVVIAVTHGQEVLALDYAVGTEPRVVATQDTSEGVRWVEVAPTCAQFLQLLNLSTR